MTIEMALPSIFEKLEKSVNAITDICKSNGSLSKGMLQIQRERDLALENSQLLVNYNRIAPSIVRE